MLATWLVPRLRLLLRREQPDARNLPIGVYDEIHPSALARHRRRYDDQVLLVSSGRAGGEPHGISIQGDDHLLDVLDIAAPRLLGDGSGLREGRPGQQR